MFSTRKNKNMIEEILSRVKKGEDLEKVLRSYGWQTFEALVAWIFQQHGYNTEVHKRFKTKKTYEIDVYAEKINKCFLVECKKWRGKTASPSKLEKAAKYHEEKVKVSNHKRKTT